MKVYCLTGSDGKVMPSKDMIAERQSSSITVEQQSEITNDTQKS